ncbi:alpha/beta hydrolase [Mesoterricola sediminis]|uniref:Alpha/beta hydrolase n=2 Tax=Mesoterricola sediminis TaxID=2927980 RepID=A0AA48KCG6_9BACT|nr:alpha/beta hydrolase [Mesoterricola sediminis]BDU76025.1 alpha/beta hydrolase [Mesoterricola sediminis]
MRPRAITLLVPAVLAAQAPAAFGPELEGFDYPFPVHRYAFRSQGLDLAMAYLDVAPEKPNGRTAVLLHGKNFTAATWEGTIRALAQAGFRVIAPDQIGFGKSTKPARYQFSFRQLAHNTRALLTSLGIRKAVLVGHSTGGMLAVRYALMFPAEVEHLVLANPIGLEDWQAEGVPALTVDQWYQRELAFSAERLRAYERATYYAGQWRPEFEAPVRMLAGLFQGPGRERVAWNSALIYDMICTQPVVYELGQLKVPTLLLIGQKDTTAIAKDAAPPAVAARLGHYPELGRRAAKTIPGAVLVPFPDLGHAPQIQDPATFHAALLAGLRPDPAVEDLK